jgi:hypothetical protein
MAMHLLIRLLVLDKRVNNVPTILLSHRNASSWQILMRISEQPNTAVCRVPATILKRTLKRSWMLSRRNYLSVSGVDRYGGGNVVVAMQEPTTVHETIYRTSETQSETSLAGPCTPPLQSAVPALESPLQKIKRKHQTTPSPQKN